MDELEIVVNIEDAGFVAKRRNMHYDVSAIRSSAERECRACWRWRRRRADGDTSVPRSCNLPARAGRERARAA
jgi:hypothetical protein